MSGIRVLLRRVMFRVFCRVYSGSGQVTCQLLVVLIGVYLVEFLGANNLRRQHNLRRVKGCAPETICGDCCVNPIPAEEEETPKECSNPGSLELVDVVVESECVPVDFVWEGFEVNRAGKG